MKIGAQLYTVRSFTKDLKGLEETLQKIADIGYRYIQVSGTCEYDPVWLKEKLQQYGLTCVLTHTKPEKMLADPQKTADEHSLFGCDYIGLGSMPGLWNFDEITDQQVADNFLENYKKVLQVFEKNGKTLMYHNHQYEFVKLNNGQNMIDYLAERTTHTLGFTVDTYWVQFGGFDPAAFIKQLSGRVPCVHFKDYFIERMQKENRGVIMAPVGSGNLNWDSIILACQEAGTRYALVEQDDCYHEDPFSCLKKSFDFLVAQGLEIE